MLQKQVSVEVDVIAEARDLRAGRDAEAGLDHAAEHDAEAERAGRVRHPHRLADPAGLRELDRDPVPELSAGRDVAQREAVLVEVDRERRAALQLPPALVPGRQRLLDVLDAQAGELWDGVERLVERPVLVHVHLERQVGDAADGADPLDVEPVAASELELQPLEPAVRDLLRAPRHVVRVTEPDCPGRRRAGPLEAEQPEGGLPGQLPLQVVQRGVNGGAGGELPRRQPLPDLVERERVVAELDLFEPRLRGRCGLLVARDRRGLAVADDAAVPHLDLDDLRLVFRAARDRERLG